MRCRANTGFGIFWHLKAPSSGVTNRFGAFGADLSRSCVSDGWSRRRSAFNFELRLGVHFLCMDPSQSEFYGSFNVSTRYFSRPKTHTEKNVIFTKMGSRNWKNIIKNRYLKVYIIICLCGRCRKRSPSIAPIQGWRVRSDLQVSDLYFWADKAPR